MSGYDARVKIHAFLVEGRIERFVGPPDAIPEAMTAIANSGREVVYLFGADTEGQFRRELIAELERRAYSP